MTDHRVKLRQAVDELERAKLARDQAILDATAAGMSRREVAEYAGVGFQRVQQIVAAARQRGR